MTRTSRRLTVLTLLTAVALGATRPGVAAPQAPPRVPAPAAPPAVSPVPPVDQFSDWRETRQRLQEVLRQYPPAVQQVLRLDPSLTGADYLTAYPNLAAFVAQHPEVSRNPAYFFGQVSSDQQPSARIQALGTFDRALAGVGVFLFFITALGVVTLIVRMSLAHRRWIRAAKIQTDAHLKLVDRLTSNEELLAYIQSPAGRQFLEAPQTPAEGGGVTAPVGRIIWSVQAGVILVVVGAGVWLVRNNLIEELAGPISALAVLAIALGAGFSLSALVAYVIAQRLGLFQPRQP
jgi:hypothetical protein